MVTIGVERMISITPSIVKSLDRVVIFLLTHSHNQILILNGPAISKGNLIALRANFVHTHVIRLTHIFTHELTGGSSIIEFGDTAYSDTYIPCS